MKSARLFSHRQPAGFTLIELLVVIAIIAILAAILFPVFAQARAKARQIACLSNMKQIGTGMYMYTQDYDEILPGNEITGNDPGYNLPGGFMTPWKAGVRETYRNWARDIQPYVKNTQIYLCPQSVPRSSVNGGNPPFNEIPAPGINTSYALSGVTETQPLAVIPTPAEIVFLHEFRTYSRTAQSRPVYNPTKKTAVQFNHFLYDGLHNSGANLLFCDSHAKWRRKSQMRFADFGAPPELNPGKPIYFSDTDAGAGTQNGITFHTAF